MLDFTVLDSVTTIAKLEQRACHCSGINICIFNFNDEFYMQSSIIFYLQPLPSNDLLIGSFL